MKKIILLLDLGFEFRGGQRQVLYLAGHLAASHDFEPLIATPRKSPLAERARKEGLQCFELPGRRDFNPFVYFSLRRAVKDRNAAIIHTNDARSASLGAMYRLFSGRETKLVHSRRVSYPLKPGWSLRKYLLSDVNAAVSREIKEIMISCGVPDRNIEVIHSGINLSLYSGKGEGRNIPLRIGAIGALSAQKGLDIFIRALAALKRKPGIPVWEAVIAGDGHLRAELERLSAESGLEDRLRFLGWSDSREVLPGLDLLVVSSTSGEGSNAVIKEGWVVGVPLIASNLDSNLELARDGQNALVYPRDNPDRLADSIAAMISDEDLCRKLVEQGKMDVAGFTDEAMAQAYMKIYSRILQ